MKKLYTTMMIVLVLAFGLVGCADNETAAPDVETQDGLESGNDTNDSNVTPPLGTGYAGRGNIAETGG